MELSCQSHGNNMEWPLSTTRQNFFYFKIGYDGCPIELMHLGYIFYCLDFCQLWTSFGGPKEETWSLALVVFILVSMATLGTFITCLLQEQEKNYDTNIRYSQPSTSN